MANITVYGITHAIVDASCAAIIFGGLQHNLLGAEYFAFLIILYNVLAFAMEAPIGIAVDNLKAPAAAAAAGCLLIVSSILLLSMPVIAIVLAGTGNALFHVGGGITALNLKPGKASMPGIFVATGALGLLAGILAGRGGYFNGWVFAVMLIAASAAIVVIKHPQISYDKKAKINPDKFELTIALLLLSIAFRALVGMILDFPWKSNIYLLVALTLAVALGKAFGGIISDKFGWARVTVPGLILSALFISFGLDMPYLAILGVFLFNMTMPVTLVAVSNMLPGRTGFAFGLTTLALIAGAFPSFTGIGAVLYDRWIVLGIVLLSSFVLHIGLKFYFKSVHNSSGTTKSNIMPSRHI